MNGSSHLVMIKHASPGLKYKLYKVVIDQIVVWDKSLPDKFLPVKNSHIQKMRVVKMWILRWMREFTRRDRIRNEDIRDHGGQVDKMREMRLKWFEDVKRRYIDALVRKCERLDIVQRVQGKVEVGRQRLERSD